MIKNRAMIVLLLTFLATSVAHASISASPTPNSDGNFTVSWSAHNADEGFRLRQSINGGPFSSGYAVYSTSKTFVGKAPGVYRYKVSYCRSLGHPDEFECLDTGYGIAEVIVFSGPMPEPDPLADQMTYEYTTKLGDINFDGKQDVFLERQTDPGVVNGAISQIILQQTTGGRFTPIVPSTSQLATVAAWAPINIDIALKDINFDGFVDIVTNGLSTFIPSAFEQVLFAPGEVLIPSPAGIAAVDSSFDEFVEQTGSWAENPNYFHENAIWIEEPGRWVPEEECELEYIWGQGWEWYCTVYWEWEDGEEYWSYDHFNQDALSFCTAMEEMEAAGGMTPGSASANKAQQSLGNVFGSKAMEGVFASGAVVIELPPLDTTSDTSWWRMLRVQLVWMMSLSIGGSTPQFQTLYRVVEPGELASIQACHCFSLGPSSLEGKQFWTNKLDAMWFGSEGLPNINYNGERSLVEVQVSKDIVFHGERAPEPYTIEGHLTFREPHLTALNADIVTKPILITYVWSGE